MTRRLMLLAGTALIAGGLTVGFSGASFSAESSNPANAFAAASSFCPNPGDVTLPASRDSYINSASGGNNFGSASTLEIRTPTLILPGTRRTLVGFDLTAVDPFCTVTGATLRLFATSSTSGRTIQVFRASGAWTEPGVSWNNQPATTGTAVTAPSGSGWRSWGVTSQVDAMIAGANNGFLVKDSNDTSILSLAQTQTYQSREGTPNSQDPELVLTVE